MHFERPKKRLIVVSNRLPVTVEREAQTGEWNYTLSSGGLVSALTGLRKHYSFVWVGWPGVYVDSLKEQEAMTEKLHSMHQCIPVFIDQKTTDLYVNSFCNQLLWPVFHYTLRDIEYDPASWEAYKNANAAFAATIAKITLPEDVVWVHDYHLMILPGLLRKLFSESAREGVKIGFFLHTPFPSSDIFRTIPTGSEILRGLCAGDLVGFHTYDYQRHFLAACTILLGLFPKHDSLTIGNHKLAVGVFPIGIEPEKFIHGLEQESVQKIIHEIRSRNPDKLIMLGVERLDYVKGVPNKLIAFERFFKRFPQYCGRVIFVEIAVPSRTSVEEYRCLRSTVNELVGHLNGTFGTLNYLPVHYLNKSVTFDELVALYAVADVCVISSIRDGMNLVAYEYIATHTPGGDGSLIISEFAGAAHSLNGAIIVNQWNVDELADAYLEALSQTAEQKRKNFTKLSAYVNKQTAVFWGEMFVARLESAVENHSIVSSLRSLGEGKETTVPLPLPLSFVREFVKDPHNLLAIEMSHLRGKPQGRFIGNLIQRINALCKENVLVFEEGNVFIDQKSGEKKTISPPAFDTLTAQQGGGCSLHNNPQWKHSIKQLFAWYQERFSVEVSVVEEVDAISFKIACCSCNNEESSVGVMDKISFNDHLFNDFFMNAELRLSHFPVKIDFCQNSIQIIGVESERHAMLKRLFQEKGFTRICYISDANDESHLFMNDWGEDIAYTCSLVSGASTSDAVEGSKGSLAKYVLVEG